MTTLLDAARQALDTLTHIIGMRHLSYIGQAMAESAARDLGTAIAEAEKAEPVGWVPTDEIRAMQTGYQQSVNMRSSRLDPASAYRMADITMLYIHPPTDDGYLASCKRLSYQVEALFTHSPQTQRPVRLTDEQILAAVGIDGSDDWTFTVARAVEAEVLRLNGIGG